MNKAILIGRLGRDPEVRTTANGDRIVSFSVATDESWRDKATGERKTRTEWHNVVVFNENLGKVAEVYMRKGSRAYLEGQIQTHKWRDKDGNERTSTEIVLPRFGGAVELLDGKPDSQAAPDHAAVPEERGGFGRRGSMKDNLKDAPF